MPDWHCPDAGSQANTQSTRIRHVIVHQLEAEGQASLNPDHLFFRGRASVYARTRPDVNAEQPKRLADMTPDERRAYNKAIKTGEIVPRDWRNERELPRKRAV